MEPAITSSTFECWRSSLPGPPRVSRDARLTVVWLEGEQDTATVDVLREMLVAEAAAGGTDLVVDLMDVTFMDASTLGAFVAGRNARRGRTGSLTLRFPSPAARRLLDLCDLRDLLGGPEVGALTAARGP